MWIWLLFMLLPKVQANAKPWISASREHTALSGNVEVSYRLASPRSDLLLQLVQVVNSQDKPVSKRDIPPKFTAGKIVFPCGLFDKAGEYAFKLVSLKQEETLARSLPLAVRWPDVTIHVPLMVETYSSDVSIQLFARNLQCTPRGSYIAFIDLVYKGNAVMTWNKPTILYTHELTGWMWNQSFEMTLDCEFFDRAGNYTIIIRTSLPQTPIVAESDTILVMWSHRYSVSVARSAVQPCNEGLSVIYHYPRCILNQDRIRVYGKALKGPLKYIRESRIESGKHSTKLSCDTFQDDYHEYCFSFVSTARNGAVFDLKTHCVPASSDIQSLSASWTDWGPWSECSLSCGTGVQSRYRLCLSTPNKSFCVGKAIQSQLCNSNTCLEKITPATELPEIWDCPCRCERNLTGSRLLNLLLNVTSECNEAITYWSVTAWPTGHVIIETIALTFPSPDCWLTIRDGKSPLGKVLAIINTLTHGKIIHSLSNVLRIELHCANHSFSDVEIICRFTRSEVPRSSLPMVRPSTQVSDTPYLTAVHITIIILAAVLSFTIMFLLLVQIFQKYKLKSLSDTSSTDCPRLYTSVSDVSNNTPSASPEDYLYKSFIFHSSVSLQPKLKWDKLPTKTEAFRDTALPVRRRAKTNSTKTVQRESTTPLAASVSELSMTGSEDGFEYDYYDFRCQQEPGSFFCPDPILMGWPPFIPLPPQGTEEFGDYPLQHWSTPSPDCNH